jgi:hypothetical protein
VKVDRPHHVWCVGKPFLCSGGAGAFAAASYRDPQAVLSPEPLQFLVVTIQGSSPHVIFVSFVAGILTREETGEVPTADEGADTDTPDAQPAIPEKPADVQFGVDWFNSDITLQETADLPRRCGDAGPGHRRRDRPGRPGAGGAGLHPPGPTRGVRHRRHGLVEQSPRHGPVRGVGGLKRAADHLNRDVVLTLVPVDPRRDHGQRSSSVVELCWVRDPFSENARRPNGTLGLAARFHDQVELLAGLRVATTSRCGGGAWPRCRRSTRSDPPPTSSAGGCSGTGDSGRSRATIWVPSSVTAPWS